jgi:glycosyltransferase involved in cell wall biosynthesis
MTPLHQSASYRFAAGIEPPVRMRKGRMGSKGKEPRVSFPWGSSVKGPSAQAALYPDHRAPLLAACLNPPTKGGLILTSRPVFSLLFTGEDATLAIPLPENLQLFMAKRRPLLLTVGLLEPEYDLPLQIDTLEDILHRFPDAGLVIAGAGSLEEELRRKIASKPYADHILLYGDLPRDATLGAMLRCAVLLRTTLYDGDSVSVREALYLETPVIATDNGMRPAGVRLVPVADRTRLRDAVFEVLSAAPPERAPAAGDGQENLRAVVEFYRELLASRST